MLASLKDRAISCEALAKHCLKQEQTHRALNAFIRLNPVLLEEAKALDDRLRAGEFLPLHGIPVAVKDNIETAGIETTGGAVALAGYVPRADASVVARLKAAGALVVGKTNLDELAGAGSTLSSLGGRTLNPFDPRRTPAGSSGGSAVAVAIGACVLALGTETVNSIRNPAHVCGVAGLRPTRGLVGLSGVIPVSPTMDVVGPMGAGVEELATMLGVMIGHDVGRFAAERWPKVAGLRVGILRGLFGAGAEHHAINAALETSLHHLHSAGAVLVEVADPVFDSGRLYQDLALHAYEFQSAFNGWLLSLEDAAPIADFCAYVADGRWPASTMKSLLDTAMATPDPAASDGYRAKRHAIADMAAMMNDLARNRRLDAFAYPAQQRPALPIGEPSRPERNGVLASALGWPALNVPVAAIEADGLSLPVGLDLMAPPLNEPTLFALGYAIETAMRR
ncbi:hypothetical protein AXW83_07065 [Bosea sp. PAMC 26642]|nr:hypothetical protein AXW83_07065 [Bosea sp. PAMC 26642]